MVNVYLSKSGMALFKTALIDNFKKTDDVKKMDYSKKLLAKIYYKKPQLKNWGCIFLKPIIKKSQNGFHPDFLQFYLLGQPRIPF